MDMVIGTIVGLVAGWLIGGAIVLRCALRGDEVYRQPIGMGNIAVMIGGLVLWPMLIFPEDGESDEGRDA